MSTNTGQVVVFIKSCSSCFHIIMRSQYQSGSQSLWILGSLLFLSSPVLYDFHIIMMS